jgi:hypothetical protein
MRFFRPISRPPCRTAAILLAALLLGAGAASAASWSTAMRVSATVVSSCSLAADISGAVPRVRSACTRGEPARVSLAAVPSAQAPLPPNPPPLVRSQVQDGQTILVVVTY